MNRTFYSNWTTVLMIFAGSAIAFWSGYQKYGFTKELKMGALILGGLILWLIWEHYKTYIKIENDKWLINAAEGWNTDYKIDIDRMVYIARAPHFIFRSWGGRMVIFYRDQERRVRQTSFAETFYSQATLKEVLEKLSTANPHIEIDPQYKTLVLNTTDNTPGLKSERPSQSMVEIEKYVASKFGPP